MLFSGDPTGEAHWEFAGVAAKAYAEWLHFCDQTDYEANVRRDEQAGLLSLFGPEPAPTREGIEQTLRNQSRAYLIEHLRSLLLTRRTLRPIDDIEATFGEMLGRAGEPAVRAAIKQVHASGLVDNDGRGDFYTRAINWTGPPVAS